MNSVLFIKCIGNFLLGTSTRQRPKTSDRQGFWTEQTYTAEYRQASDHNYRQMEDTQREEENSNWGSLLFKLFPEEVILFSFLNVTLTDLGALPEVSLMCSSIHSS